MNRQSARQRGPATPAMFLNTLAPARDRPPQIDELLRSNRSFELRLRELAAANDGLQRAVALEARRLQTILAELALAADRVGDRSLADVIRAVAAAPSDLSPVAACGRSGERAGGHAGEHVSEHAGEHVCGLHAQAGCARCRAVGPAQPLSAREREVLRLLTEGSRSPCIAAHLGISVATVEVHRRNIMRKLGLHTIALLTKYALREGLTSL
jgi:DNA-binding CsgD family transcriptional regulator